MFQYDQNYRLEKIKKGRNTELVGGNLPDANTINSFTYDSKDRVWTRTDSKGVTLTYEYNNLDKLTKITFPDSKYIQIDRSPDHPDIVDRVTDRSQQTTNYYYDALNQLIQVKGPIQGTSNTYIYDFRYDKNGNLWKIIDSLKSPAVETVFDYNLDNLMKKKTYANGKFEEYTYDKMGLPLTFKNARLSTSTYAHDENHNLTGISYNDGTTPSVTFHYDDYNRLDYRTEGSGANATTTYYTYYDNNWLHTVSGPWPDSLITYVYDGLGNIQSLTQGAQAISYSYDYTTETEIPVGRLRRIALGAVEPKKYFVYDYVGGTAGVSPLIERLTRPGGGYTVYGYESQLKRLSEVSNYKMLQNEASGLINRFLYAYNDKDLIESETITNGESITNFTAGTTSYSPNNLNQVTSSNNPNQAFVYDDDGNMTTGFTPAGYPITMTYDAQNRMKTASYNDGNFHLFQYSYAGNSLLSEVIKDGNATKYLRAGFLPLQERDAVNAVAREYTWGLNLGGGIGGLLNLKQSGVDHSYIYDGKGNVSAVLDDAQQVVASYAYDPFGRLMTRTGALDQPYTFSTKEYESGTGQYYYGYRFYDSCSGKWTTRDPLGEAGGMNLYQAVGNNPVNFVDPLGLEYQLTIGVSLSIGGSPFIFPGFFLGGGLNIGLTSSGQFIIQPQASITGGAGLYAGVGAQIGISHSDCETASGVSTQKQGEANFNAGWGPSVGGSATYAGGGNIGLIKGVRGGAGFGVQASAGMNTTSTIAVRIPFIYRWLHSGKK